MNKMDMAKAVSQKVEGTQKDAEKYIDAVLTTIEDSIKAGEDIRLTGYFNIEIKDVKERQVLVNPKQPGLGKKMCPAHKAVKVKVSKKLQELV